MRAKIIVFFIVLFMLMGSFQYKSNNTKRKDINISKKEDIIIDNKKEVISNVNIIYNNEERMLDFEEYILGVVACEMPSSFNIEALKAMAIAARTFALYKVTTNKNYKLSTTTKDQCYISVDQMKKNWKNDFNNNYKKIKKAVDETKNKYMTYNDKVIIAFYFSISNGYTENCEDVFVQKLDYLKSVDSSWDKEYSYKEKTIKYNKKDLLRKLGIKETNINDVKIERSDTGRVSNVIVNNIKYKGTKFRTLLGLRSTDFKIEIKDDNIYISTKGYGHGVGMSQYGANAMANKGYKYDEILKYYYTGVQIHE